MKLLINKCNIMKTFKMVMALLACVGLLACNSSSASSTVQDSSAIIKSIQISDYDEIELNGCVEFYYTPNSESAFLEIESDKAEKIKVWVEGRTLKINTKGEFKKCIIRSGSLNLKEVETSGSCHLYVTEAIKCHDFDVKTSGVSVVAFQKPVQLGECSLDLCGTSVVNMSGEVTECDIEISGSANVSAASCNMMQLDVESSGCSEISVGQVKQLEYEMSGTSQLSYQGNPTIAKAHTSGNANVVRR